MSEIMQDKNGQQYILLTPEEALAKGCSATPLDFQTLEAAHTFVKNLSSTSGGLKQLQQRVLKEIPLPHKQTH